MDLLYDHLMRARATGAVFARTVVEPPWGLRLGGSIQLAVHAVTRGKAWLWLDDPTSAVELLPGEITLVRGGPDHYIAHEPGADCLEPDDFRSRHSQDAPVADHAGDGVPVRRLPVLRRRRQRTARFPAAGADALVCDRRAAPRGDHAAVS